MKNIFLLLICAVSACGTVPSGDITTSTSSAALEISDFSQPNGTARLLAPDGKWYRGSIDTTPPSPPTILLTTPAPAPPIPATLPTTPTANESTGSTAAPAAAIAATSASTTQDTTTAVTTSPQVEAPPAVVATVQPSNWRDAIADAEGPYYLALKAEASARELLCRLQPVEGMQIYLAGTAKCVYSDGTTFAFHYDPAANRKTSNPDFSNIDNFLRTLLRKYQKLDPFIDEFASTPEALQKRLDEIQRDDGIALWEAVAIAQNAVVSESNKYDVWHPFVSAQDERRWRVLFLSHREWLSARMASNPDEAPLVGVQATVDRRSVHAAPVTGPIEAARGSLRITASWTTSYQLIEKK